MSEWINYNVGDPVPDGDVRIRDIDGWESEIYSTIWVGWEYGLITHYMKKEHEMKLEVGKTYYNPDGGEETTVVAYYECDGTYECSNGYFFEPDGRFQGGGYCLEEIQPTQPQDTYITILETFVGPEATKLAKKIAEALE